MAGTTSIIGLARYRSLKILLAALLTVIPVYAAGAASTKNTLPTRYDKLVHQNAKEHLLPSSLILAVIRTESNFNPKAFSTKGARGLMQLMPETAQRYGVRNSYNPAQNIRAGVAYLRDMMDRFKSLTLALAAYNSGPDTVERFCGVPPIEETRAFIRSVYKYYNLYRRRIDRHAPTLEPDWKAAPAETSP